MEQPGRVPAGDAQGPFPWLPLARVAWGSALALALGLFIAGIPVIARELRRPCTGTGCYRWQASDRLAADLAASGLSVDFYAAYKIALEALLILVFCGIAAVIARRRPDEPMALFAAIMLVTFAPTFSDTILALGQSAPLWRWPRTLLACLGWSTLFVFFYLFPDGRWVPRWTRLAAVGWVVFVAISSFSPLAWASNSGATAAARDTSGGSPLFSLGVLCFFATVVIAQAHRYRRVSTPVQRQQAKWVLCGFVAAFGGLALNILVVGPVILRSDGSSPLPPLLGLLGFYAALLLLPLSVGVAILRHRLYAIDIIINRTLVYTALTACVVGLYILIVGYLAALFRTGGNLLVSLAATGLVAVLFQPLRERLQRGVNRLVYGERDDPYAVLSRLGQRLEATLAPDAVLPTIVQTIRETLKLPYAAIALEQDGGRAVVVASGTPAADALRLPLAYRQEPVGELILAPRAPGEGFNPADRRLLDDLARQAGVAAHAVRLTADLQRSRERLVTAREEERRRLRRDLHDGLGPMLGGLTLRLDTARKLMHRDPAAADTLLTDLKKQTQSAIVDIRRLVYALRPPALDELGLVPALREAAVQFGFPGRNGDDLRIALDIPDDLPPLPAAVEVAVYLIAQEALTNVARHAEAEHCHLRLSLDAAAGLLSLEVSDDGAGIQASRHAGVGLGSMRERAAELGGACVIESLSGGGTRVRARLPYAPPATSGGG